MTRQMPFQYDRPTFVRIPFRAAGKDWTRDQELKWKELSLDENKVLILYCQGYLYHSSDLEVTMSVGDGLEVMDLEALHALVGNINKKVKAKTSTELEYNRKKCKISQIIDKQRGLIRSWRRGFGKMESE